MAFHSFKTYLNGSYSKKNRNDVSVLRYVFKSTEPEPSPVSDLVAEGGGATDLYYENNANKVSEMTEPKRKGSGDHPKRKRGTSLLLSFRENIASMRHRIHRVRLNSSESSDKEESQNNIQSPRNSQWYTKPPLERESLPTFVIEELKQKLQQREAKLKFCFSENDLAIIEDDIEETVLKTEITEAENIHLSEPISYMDEDENYTENNEMEFATYTTALPKIKNAPRKRSFSCMALTVNEEYKPSVDDDYSQACLERALQHRQAIEQVKEVWYKWGSMERALDMRRGEERFKIDAEKDWNDTLEKLGWHQDDCDRGGLKAIETLHSKATLEVLYGPKKSFWQNTPQVLSSRRTREMSKHRIKFHEALFEVVTSQASYIHNLTILNDSFMDIIKGTGVITNKKFHAIFAKVKPIIKAAEIFYESLIQLWEHDIMLCGLAEATENYYKKVGSLYVSYARHTTGMIQDLKIEMAENQDFCNLIHKLQKRPEVRNLPIDSYLSLPVQRITRMPLLFRTAASLSDSESAEHAKLKKVLNLLEKIASDCDRQVEQMTQFNDMMNLNKDPITFAQGVPYCPVFNSSRHLKLRSRVRGNHYWHWPGGKLQLFLFSDLFLYGKQKRDHKLEILDYCPLPALRIAKVKNSGVTFTLMTNCNGLQKTLTVTFDVPSERNKWVTALEDHEEGYTPPASSSNEDTSHEDTSHEDTSHALLKQMIVATRYDGNPRSKFNLQVGDVAIVLCERNDLMFGEKLQDGETGWFPTWCAKEITSKEIKNFNLNIKQKLLLENYAFKKSLDLGDWSGEETCL